MQSGSLIRTPMVLLARNVPPSLWQSSMKIGLNKVINHFIFNIYYLKYQSN
jgi:hypothetical protein